MSCINWGTAGTRLRAALSYFCKNKKLIFSINKISKTVGNMAHWCRADTLRAALSLLLQRRAIQLFSQYIRKTQQHSDAKPRHWGQHCLATHFFSLKTAGKLGSTLMHCRGHSPKMVVWEYLAVKTTFTCPPFCSISPFPHFSIFQFLMTLFLLEIILYFWKICISES